MLTHQQEAVLAILADGRWHGVEDFMTSHIPDYRKRLSELRALYPSRFISRYRTRKAKEPYRAKDWRDTSLDSHMTAAAVQQLDAFRRQEVDGAAQDTAGIVRIVGYPVRSVTWGQLRLMTSDALAELVLASWRDPWSR